MPRTLALCALLLAAALATAESPFAPGEVRVTTEVEPATATPGEIVTLTITAEISPGYHIASPDEDIEKTLPTQFAATAPLENLGGLSTDDEPESFELAGVGTLQIYEGKVVFSQDVLVSGTAKPGVMEKLGSLSFVPCTKKECLKPGAVDVIGKLEIIADPDAASAKPPVEEAPKDDSVWKPGEVRIETQVAPAEAAPGEEVVVTIRAKISPTWHIYAPDETNEFSLPTTFAPAASLEAAADLTADRKSTTHNIPGVGDVHYFEGEVVLTQKLRVKADAKPGEFTELGTLDYMPCDADSCLAPSSVSAKAEFKVNAAPPGWKPPAPAPIKTKEGQKLDEARRKGLFAFMWACAGFALLALLTPCVYPMIPITVSYFTKAAHANRAEAFAHALAYAGGIIVTYVGFAVIVRAILGEQGATWIATNAWVNLAVAAVFVVFGLSLMGMFDLRLPSSWVNRMNQVAGRSTGYLGDFLMGFTFTLAAFTCTVPIIGVILRLGVEVDTFHMLLGMLTYATVFAAPFFVLALVPSVVKSLPRSGGWLNSVKVLLAIIEFAAALKFLSAADFAFGGPPGTYFTYTVVVFSWAVLMLLSGFYLLGTFRFEHDPPVTHLSVPRFLLAAGFLVFGAYLTGGGLGRPLAPWIASFAPPPEQQHVPEGTSNVSMQNLPVWARDHHQNGRAEWAAARKLAASSKKPIFLEFSGFNCANCRSMENTILREPEVVAELEKHFVSITLFTDRDVEPWLSNRQSIKDPLTGDSTNPLYVVLAPDGKEVLALSGYTQSREEFLEFLATAERYL